MLQAAEELQDFLQQVQAAKQKPLGSKPSPASWLAGKAHSQRVMAVLAYGLDEADTAQTKLAIDTMHVSPDLDACRMLGLSNMRFGVRGFAQKDCLRLPRPTPSHMCGAEQEPQHGALSQALVSQQICLWHGVESAAFCQARGSRTHLQPATVPCRRWAGQPAWGRHLTCCRTWVCGASMSSAASSRLASSSTSPLKSW